MPRGFFSERGARDASQPSELMEKMGNLTSRYDVLLSRGTPTEPKGAGAALPLSH